MKLNRLAKPCTCLIDLRTHRSNVEFEIYEHDEHAHVMDSHSIVMFEKMINRYGKYTVGVYEYINANFTKEKETIEQHQFSDGFTIKPIVLTTEFLRNEERMHLAVSANIYRLYPTDIPRQL